MTDRRSLAPLGVVGAALLFFAFWAWQYHSRTPEAAVHRLVDAIEAGDPAGVRDGVDLDRVLADAWRQLSPDTAGGAPDPALLAREREQLLRTVATGPGATGASPPTGAADTPLDRARAVLADPAVRFAGIRSTDQDRNTAKLRVGLRYPEIDTVVPLTLRMENGEGGWRVVRLDDLGVLASEVARLRSGAAPPGAAPAAGPE